MHARTDSIENTPRALLLTVLVLLARTPAAHAQINSLPPPLQGQPSYHLYTVPGVTSSNGVYTETLFRCMNTTSESIRVGVEVFDSAGNLENDASATSLDLFPGGTYGFSTGPVVGINAQSDLGAGLVSTGSARILATKPKGVVCTAFLGDPTNTPPGFMVHLNVFKKTKQKGD